MTASQANGTVGQGRRQVLAGSMALAAAAAARPSQGASRATQVEALPPQTSWTPEPAQAPAKAGFVEVHGAKLSYWDTGGPGEAVVLLHPITGSEDVWGYQQPVLAAAGYRVVAYSRRGHGRSEHGPADAPGTAVGDLDGVVGALGLDRFHLVGSAAGGFIAPDYAISFPGRLLSLTVASSLGGVTDPVFLQTTTRISSDGLEKMSAVFRELGPSYRAANPAGVARWDALRQAATQGPRAPARALNDLSWANIGKIDTPALLLTGDADLYLPPSRLREMASHYRHGSAVVIREAGHSAYWEQPEAFNHALLDFFRRNRRRSST